MLQSIGGGGKSQKVHYNSKEKKHTSEKVQMFNIDMRILNTVFFSTCAY